MHIKTTLPLWLLILLSLAATSIMGCSTASQEKMAELDRQNLEQQWGIEPVALRLVGSDHFIDFRYKVIDPEKARGLLSRSNEPYLIDEESGKVHTVPVTKLGPMRASAVMPKVDRNYVVLFGNTHKIIKKGSRVTVVIGNFRAQNMLVL